MKKNIKKNKLNKNEFVKEIIPDDIWSDDKIDKIKQFINKEIDKLSPAELKERKIFIELLTKKYKEEDEFNRR